MRLANVHRILYMLSTMDAEGNPHTVPMEEFSHEYPTVTPSGLNLYIGIDNATVAAWKGSGTALESDTKQALDSVLAYLGPDRTELMVDVSLEPVEQSNPYGVVNDNLDMLIGLANQLASYQSQAIGKGGSLKVVVRYASEMNDPSTPKQPYGRPVDARGNSLPWQAHAATFKDSFARVSSAMRGANSQLDFTFSPALRSDVVGPDFDMIAQYQPDLSDLQRISCTWYVGQVANMEPAISVLRQYFAQYSGKNLPFGIDEMGGDNERTVEVDGQPLTLDGNNDAMLELMLTALEDSSRLGISFDSVTLFLDDKWRTDTSLAFLTFP